MTARPPSDAGVSLVEVLVALAIVAVMATAAVVMIRPGEDPRRQTAEQLTRALAEAKQTALVTGRPVGFAADPDGRGWRFFDYVEGRWTPDMDHPAFAPVRFGGEDILLTVEEGAIGTRAGVGGDARLATAPQVWFDPAGADTPFRYALTGGDRDPLFLVRDGQGRVALHAFSEAEGRR
ncbi:MAG: GspH/FimT family pseudopilin [Oceanicaulis sp.]